MDYSASVENWSLGDATFAIDRALTLNWSANINEGVADVALLLLWPETIEVELHICRYFYYY